MSSSSEALPALPWVRMEYSEARKANAVSSDGDMESATESAAIAPEPPLDPEIAIAARVEAERERVAAACRREAAEELQRLRASLGDAVNGFAQERQQYFLRVEAEVVQLALAIARRILHRESQIDPKLLASVVRYELQQLEAGTEVRLIVARESLPHWQHAAASMPCPVTVESETGVGAEEVRIETALGSCRVDFEAELKEIERGFMDLLALRPPAPAPGSALVQ